MSLKTIRLSMYSKVNNGRAVAAEEISSSMFSSTYGSNRRKLLMYMDLMKRLPLKKENIFLVKANTSMEGRPGWVTVLFPGGALYFG